MYAKNNNINISQFAKEYNNADNIDSVESAINKIHKYLKSKSSSALKFDDYVLDNFGHFSEEENQEFKKHAGIDFDYAVLLSDEYTDEQKIRALKRSFNDKKYRYSSSQIDSSEIETQFYKDLANLKETKDYQNFYDIYKSAVSKLSARYDVADNAVEYNLNGKIDKNFKQGNTGDCWLLASIKLLSRSSKGLKILNDSIHIDKNGNAIVHLQGVDKTYKISRKEIENSKELSTGDSDVRAIEIAVNRYLHDTYRQTGEGKASIEGGFEYKAYEILTGQDGRSFFEKFFNEDPQRDIDDDIIEKIKKSNILACASSHPFMDNVKSDSFAVDVLSGKKVKLYSHHAYTISKVTNKEVFLINPWDTSKTIKLSMKEFRNFFTSVQLLDVNDL